MSSRIMDKPWVWLGTFAYFTAHYYRADRCARAHAASVCVCVCSPPPPCRETERKYLQREVQNSSEQIGILENKVTSLQQALRAANDIVERETSQETIDQRLEKLFNNIKEVGVPVTRAVDYGGRQKRNATRVLLALARRRKKPR